MNLSQTGLVFDTSQCIDTITYKHFLHLCHQLSLRSENLVPDYSPSKSNNLVLGKCHKIILTSESSYREYNLKYGDISKLITMRVIPDVHI